MLKSTTSSNEPLRLAPWIKTRSGDLGTVVYNFHSKNTYVFSSLIWEQIITWLPDDIESIYSKLCAAFPSATPQRLNSFLEKLTNVGILIHYSEHDRLHIPKEDLSYTDEIAGFPKYVSLELTTLCNYKCIHCYLGESRNVPLRLSKSTLAILKRDLMDLCVENVQITGGEPLILEDSAEIIESFAAEFSVELTTNGSHLNDSLYAALKNVNSVQISIYGFSENSYSQFTKTNQSNILNNVLNNALKMKSLGVNISMAFLISKGNINELERFVFFCRENGIEYRLGFSMPVGECRNNIPLLTIDHDKKREIFRKYHEAISNESTLNKYCCNPNKLSILADGRVFSCSMLRDKSEYALGNIYNDSVNNIWSENIERFAKDIELDNQIPCAHCELRYACGGICPALEKEEIVGTSAAECKVYNERDLLIFRVVDNVS